METLIIGLMGLVVGCYGYTFKVNQGAAKKEDVEDLRARTNILYEHLLNRPISEEEVQKRISCKIKKGR